MKRKKRNKIRQTTCEREVFVFARGDQHFIDELAAVIAINPQNGKGEERACALEGGQDRLLAPMQEGETFRPPSRYIGERQGVQIASLDVGATMSHQICFQKAGSGFIPLLKGANRDLLLEQRSRSSGGEARTIQFALRGQQAIRRCRAQGKQLFSALLREVEVLMPFQRLKERGRKGMRRLVQMRLAAC